MEMDNNEVTEPETGLFTMDSRPCMAARKAFPTDLENKLRD